MLLTLHLGLYFVLTFLAKQYSGQQCCSAPGSPTSACVNSCAFNDWTPWDCTCCSGTGSRSSYITRTRQLCCQGTYAPSDLPQCFTDCSKNQDEDTVTAAVCSDVCSCDSSTTSPPGTLTTTPESGDVYLCYDAADDVSRCGGECAGARDSWEECVRRCATELDLRTYKILSASLFVVGLAVGILITCLARCLVARKKTARARAVLPETTESSRMTHAPNMKTGAKESMRRTQQLH